MDINKTWKFLTAGWLGFITYAILGAVIALAVQSVSGKALETDLPIVTVSSASMVPYLDIGDIVLVKGGEDYKIGDVIVFDGWRDKPIIHRVVASYNGTDVEKIESFEGLRNSEIKSLYQGEKIFITKGDNNQICDQCVGNLPITLDNIHGRQIFKIPYLGLVKIGAVRLVDSFV